MVISLKANRWNLQVNELRIIFLSTFIFKPCSLIEKVLKILNCFARPWALGLAGVPNDVLWQDIRQFHPGHEHITKHLLMHIDTVYVFLSATEMFSYAFFFIYFNKAFFYSKWVFFFFYKKCSFTIIATKTSTLLAVCNLK